MVHGWKGGVELVQSGCCAPELGDFAPMNNVLMAESIVVRKNRLIGSYVIQAATEVTAVGTASVAHAVRRRARGKQGPASANAAEAASNVERPQGLAAASTAEAASNVEPRTIARASISIDVPAA
jgi:hypothetical protein